MDYRLLFVVFLVGCGIFEYIINRRSAIKKTFEEHEERMRQIERDIESVSSNLKGTKRVLDELINLIDMMRRN